MHLGIGVATTTVQSPTNFRMGTKAKSKPMSMGTALDLLSGVGGAIPQVSILKHIGSRDSSQTAGFSSVFYKASGKMV